MSVAHAVFPDLEALASYIIRTGVNGSRVYSSIPKNPTYPLVIVKRIAGIPVNQRRLDAASLQIEVWGTSKTEAFDLADDARVALLDAQGTTYTVIGGAPVDGFISAVDVNLGMTWLPDPLTNKDRYIFGISMIGHD